MSVLEASYLVDGHSRKVEKDTVVVPLVDGDGLVGCTCCCRLVEVAGADFDHTGLFAWLRRLFALQTVLELVPPGHAACLELQLAVAVARQVPVTW